MISPRTLVRGVRAPALPRIRPVGLAGVRALRRLEPLHIVWLVLWAPWWVANELPPPAAPRLRDADMVDLPEGTPGAWLLDTLDDLRFRFGLTWTAALLLRGAWLGGVAGIIWIGLGMTTAVPSPTIRQLLIVVAMGAALGVILRIFHRPRYGAVAMLLERSFDLRSRLTTAVAALRYGERDQGALHELQLADAANALNRCRALLRPGHWVPIREIFIVFIVATTMLLLLVSRRPEGEIPPLSTTGVPHFVPVSERLAAAAQEAPPVEEPDAATLQEVEDISRTSNQAREDLEAIGDALDETAVTNPAAEAIANEDYAGANRELQEASQEVTDLPESEREALADELDEAADNVSEDNPELAEAARNAADDVRSGEDTGALGDLGEQIERTGESVVRQQPTGGDLSESSTQQQGDSQSGAPGGSASSPGEQPEPAEGGSGEAQPGADGDPGAGMEASGGVGSSDEPGEQQGSGGTGEEGGESASGQGAPTDGEQEGDASGSDEGESGETSPDGSSETGNMTGRPNEEDGASQGSGAGGGQRNANDPVEGEQTGGDGGDLENDDEAPDAGEGEAGDPPPGGPDDESGEEEETTASGGGSSIMLPGTSSERVSSGSDVGSSSVGSGGGVGAGSGDSTSSVSGSSGPDPNDVPARWRTIVEDYFRDGGAP